MYWAYGKIQAKKRMTDGLIVHFCHFLVHLRLEHVKYLMSGYGDIDGSSSLSSGDKWLM